MLHKFAEVESERLGTPRPLEHAFRNHRMHELTDDRQNHQGHTPLVQTGANLQQIFRCAAA